MNETYQRLINLFKKFDTDLTPIDQHTVNNEIKNIIPTENYKPEFKETAEFMAFNLAEKLGGDQSYGTYFGPFFTSFTHEGIQYDNPPLQSITPEMIVYWEKRSSEVLHPYLIARYSGLAWDLTSLVSKEPVNQDLRIKFTNASLQIVERKLFTSPQIGLFHLRRGMNVATKFNDQYLFPRIKNLIIDLEKEFSVLPTPAPWGFGFDILFKNKKLAASPEELKGLIENLEKKLFKFSTPNQVGKTDPWAAQHAASRLADYYTSLKLPTETKRVILQVGIAYEPLFANVNKIQVAGWMQKLFELYKFYQLKDEAEDVLKRLREISKEASDEMGGFAHSFNIPKEQVDELIVNIYSVGDETVFANIVNRFVPSKEVTKDSLLKLAKEAPMQFLFSKDLQDNKGRKVAEVGSIEDDLEGNIILGIAEQFPVSSFFLHHVLAYGVEKGILTTNTILKFLMQSAIINASRIPIFEKAIEAYLRSDFLVFIHLAIPQFEDAVRYLVELNGGNVLKYKNNIYNLRTFDDILRDPIVSNVFGDDLQTYLRILFTDARGWNLRNEVCHGLVEIEFFNKQVSDRLIHALFCVGMVRFIQTAVKP
jgi:hypothetical protein